MAVGLLLLACVGCSGGPASVSGTFSGSAMSARDAISFASLNPPPALSQIAVLITDYSGACQVALADATRKNSSTVSILARTRNGFDAGTFDMTGTDPAFLFWYDRLDAACHTTLNLLPQSGTFSLSRLDASGVTGAFDAVMSTGEHVTGSFFAAACSGAFADGGAGSGPCE
jgi:hypothetical protein